MTNIIKRWFKDPWKIFSLIAILVAITLIIIPQLRLFQASIKDEMGKFRIKSEKATGRLELIPEATEGFQVEGDRQRLTIAGREQNFITLTADGQGILLIESLTGEELKHEIMDDKLRVFTTEEIDFAISQEVFAQSIFARPEPPRPLSVEEVDGGSALRLIYQPGAYLLFDDKRTISTLSNYAYFFRNSRYIEAIKNSIIVTLISTLLSTTLAVTLAYYLARYHIPGKNIIISLITMASVSPPFLGGYAWRILLGSQGILTTLFRLDFTIVGIHGVIWVITWLVFPLIFLLSYDAFTTIDKTLIESSLSLGASKGRTLFKIIIPLALPGVLTGVYMVMMQAFADFGTPYVISVNLNVLPVLIYKEFMNEVGGNFSIASTGSIIMIIISTVILMGQRIYLASKSYASISSSRNLMVMQPSKKKKYLITAYAFLLLTLAFVPHITVTITSFFKWSSGVLKPLLTLANYSKMFELELNTIYISLFLGFTATFLDIIFGVGIAYVIVRKRYSIVSSFLNFMVMIPYVISGTVLGIGFIMIFNTPPLVLTGTWLILVLSYFIRKLPFSVKSAESVLYQIHPALEEAANVFGARPLKGFFDITFKIMIGGVISGATLSFLHIMTEISSTIVLYRPPWKTMTTVIFENTTRTGSDFGVAAAMTVVLMLIIYVPLYLITKKTRSNKRGEEMYVQY